MKYLGYLLLVFVAVCGSTAKAATYYLDAINGDDALSGTSRYVSATNGPWKSIKKVNTANLLAGDQVLFSCGQTWNETLKPLKNGTATANIYFGSYPKQCTNQPKISGFNIIANYNWQPYQGNIWKTTLRQNLIINNSLSVSVDNWKKWPADASTTFKATCPLSVAGCMNVKAGTSFNALAISNSFPVVSGQVYTVIVSFYAQSGTSVALMVRQNSKSWTDVGFAKKGIIGNGQWKNISVTFTATRTIPNARLDIEVPITQQIFVQYANVQASGVQSQLQPQPSSVLFDADPVTIAHHPNTGYNPAQPMSSFFNSTAASPTVIDNNGLAVSSQIVIPDLQLPSRGSINTNTQMMLHSADWKIDAYTVTGVNAQTLAFTPNTPFPLSMAGWGFYFYNALWMLDSPGESFFDNALQTLYLWTRDNKSPGSRVSIAAIDTAIDLSARSNITVENLEITGATTGVNLSKSTNLTLSHLNIHDISGRAIDAVNSKQSTIDSNNIIGTGLSAIDVADSSNALITNNTLSEIGVSLDNTGKLISLPVPTEAAIQAGPGSIIQYNTLSDIGNVGVFSSSDNLIDSNVIQRTCLIISDCGGIYLTPSAVRTTVSNNLILDVVGYVDGIPDRHAKIANGIYLDDGISDIIVSGNTIKGGTNAIHIHNGANNSLSDNVLYGSERALLFQQENSLATGGVSGNIVSDNLFFPTSLNGSIYSSSTFGDVVNFATYDYNHYSIISSPQIVNETRLGFSRFYKFSDWQKATTNGIARNNDLHSDTPAPLTSFAQGVNGLDSMTNGNFSAGLTGWGSWNATAPYSRRTLEGCLPVSVNCLHIKSGASLTRLKSPTFALTKGTNYRITYDLKSSTNNYLVSPIVLFAGPTNYSILTIIPEKVTTSTRWTRHSFIFEATATANPAINDQGARFDIENIPAGQDIWIANLEIAPYIPGVLGVVRSDMLINKTGIARTMDCPTRSQLPDLCSSYFVFPEGVPVTWPISVPPRSGKIVFTQNRTLYDTDSDGVADYQDDCKKTNKLEVNTRGCSLLN